MICRIIADWCPLAVLIAYHLQKMPYIFPLLGGNKISQLRANIEALKISLSDEQIKEIEAVVPFDLGYPQKYIVCLFCSFQTFYAEAWGK